MNDESFARLVAEEVKNRVDDHQREYLRQPSNWGRWLAALEALLANIDAQLQDLDDRERRARESYEPMGEQGLGMLAEQLTVVQERRQKAQRFRFHVETRLNEVHRRIVIDEVGEDGDSMAFFLRRAIETHEALINAAEEDDTIDTDAVDEALWAALDGEWTFPVR